MEVYERPVRRSGAPARTSAGPRRRQRRTSALVTQVSIAAIALFAFAGVARVAVAVRAQEAAIDAHRLERSIRTELLETRELEADLSALEAPSRIGALASSALHMSATAPPKYICIPSARTDTEAPGTHASEGASRKGRLAGLVEEIVASEAQALLVGDVGLASRR
jgi:hypothetical protein